MGGLAVLDDIRLIAPGPQTVTGGQAQRFGAAGMNDFNYWIVAHYPIGISISGPFFVRDAPNVLDPANYVLVVWDRTIGAVSYDVLRTATAEFPQGSGFFAVATGLTQTTARDQGQALTFYAPPAPPQSPATCRIHLNNRDYAQPTLQMPCSIAVTSIIFADGTQQSTAGGGGGGQNQTPWLSDINGAGFSLGSVGTLGIIGSANTILTPLNVTASPLGSLAQFRNNRPTSNASISIANDLGTAVLTLLVGGSQQSNPTTFQNQGIISVTQATQAILFCTNSTIERMRITSSGVGIGTIAPAYALDVAGDINVSGQYRVNGVPLSTGGAAQTPWTSNIDGGNFRLSNTASISIGTTLNSIYPFDIRSTGFSTAIHVSADSTDTGAYLGIRDTFGTVLLTCNASFSGSAFTNKSPYGWVITDLSISGMSVYVGAGAAGPISLPNPMLAITTNGVGIGNVGSTLPQADNQATNFIVGSNLAGLNHGMATVICNTSTAGALVGGFQFANGALTTSEKRVAYISSILGAANNSGLMLFYTYNAGVGAERMRIDNVGNVGIANLAPAYSLDVTGDINITGNYRINGGIVALATQLEIVPLMTRIRALEDEVNHLKPTGRRRRK